MTLPSEQLTFQVDSMRRLVHGIESDQWSNPTFCEEWTVRGVVNHLAMGGEMFAASFRGETLDMGADPPSDVLGDDPPAVIDSMISTFEESVNSAGAMERDAVLPFATLPADVALNIAKFDILLHCYDIAAATDQPFDPPDDVMQEARQIADAVVPGLRDGETFGSEIAAPAGATPMQQLAAFSGRRV